MARGHLARESDLVPVLVTMRELTKGVTLEQLLAQHMTGDDSYHHASFRYLLRQGRIVLLFDGFDELVARTDYERVTEHFATLREAADGAAKVVVTSRHQHFATDRDTHTALGGEARSLPGSRTMRLRRLDIVQQHRLVADQLDDEAAAEQFLNQLRDVHGLLDLALNPRMLSFMVRWYREGLLSWTEDAARSGERITAGRLYERLLTTWLEHERKRQETRGGPRVLSVEQRMHALTELALLLWADPDRRVRAADLGEFAEQVLDLPALRMRAGEAAHALGSSTVLVRRPDDSFGFIHQSVSEWLVARWAGEDLEERLADRLLTPLMADFLCDLVGEDTAVDWGRRATAAEEGFSSEAKANAALVLQRRNAATRGVSYRGQSLRDRDLSALDLSHADLRGADLSGSVLPRAMRAANLVGARLVGALADGVDLSGANLRRADLTRSRLLGADLTGARLDGARLDGAALIGSSVSSQALSAVAGAMGVALPDADVALQVATVSPVADMLVTVGGSLVVTGHADGSLRWGDPARGLWLRISTWHRGSVTALVADPTGTWLASAGDDGTVGVWDPATGQARHTLTGHTGTVGAGRVAPDGTWLATAGGDGTVRVWDPRHRHRTPHPHRPHRRGAARWRSPRTAPGWPPPAATARCGSGTRPPAPTATPSPATPAGCGRGGRPGRHLAGHRRRRRHGPDLGPGHRHRTATPSPATPTGCTALAVAPDGTGSPPPATTARSGSGTPPPAPTATPSPATPARCTAVAVAPDGTCCHRQRRRHGPDLGPRHRHPRHTLTGHTGWVRGGGGRPGRHLLATAGDDGTVRIWDPHHRHRPPHPHRPHQPR